MEMYFLWVRPLWLSAHHVRLRVLLVALDCSATHECMFYINPHEELYCACYSQVFFAGISFSRSVSRSVSTYIAPEVLLSREHVGLSLRTHHAHVQFTVVGGMQLRVYRGLTGPRPGMSGHGDWGGVVAKREFPTRSCKAEARQLRTIADLSRQISHLAPPRSHIHLIHATHMIRNHATAKAEGLGLPCPALAFALP